jgi:hypothetical protein
MHAFGSTRLAALLEWTEGELTLGEAQLRAWAI